MKNIDEVRSELSKVFYDLKTGKIQHKEASELNNCAGKIISSAKVELDYQHLCLGNNDLKIPFFEYTESKE